MLLSFSFLIKAQNVNEVHGSISILDSVIVKAKCHSAIELHVRLHFDTDKALIFPRFYEFVNSDGVYASIKDSNADNYLGNYGLSYVILDSLGRYIYTGYGFTMASFETIEAEDRFYNSRWVVDKHRKKAKFKWIKDEKKRMALDRSEMKVAHGDTIVTLYPMILQNKDSYLINNEDLLPGEYSLFLFYSNDKSIDSSKGTIFSGVMKSNSIKLIVR